ncbi:FAD-binding oxidoreductase [soil metagenome]
MTTAVAPDVIDRLKALLGEGGWSQDPDRLAPKLVEWRERWSGETPILLLPKSTAEVAAIVGLCAETRTPITPQGGNTGLVGGQIPQGEVLLSLDRMNRIRDIDRRDDVIIAEAGVTLAAVHEAALGVGRRFPLSLASEGSCTVGGNISTNAGGTAVLRFGNMRDLVLGIEAVLPNGEVLNGIKRLRKDNTGYDLKQFFIGAEGTLGVVTAASLKLFPEPASRAVAMAGLASLADCIDLLGRAKEASGSGLEGFELISRAGMELAIRHIPNHHDPMAQPHAWYALIDIAAEIEGAAETAMMALLEPALESGLVQDAVIAQTVAQASALWSLRENQSSAQKSEGPAWKNDISVPVARIPEFVAETDAALQRLSPGVRSVPFGHAGDGNLHYDILAPLGSDPKLHMAMREQAHTLINDMVDRYEGSISAEHGIGVMKAGEALHYKQPAAVAAMRAIRAALDPLKIMNPSVLF